MIPASLNTMMMSSSFTFYSDLFPAPTHAYCLYKLNKNYTGNCIEIGQWNGVNLVNLTQIGFDANNFVDVAAISAWSSSFGGATPYVSMFYDQFGTNDCNQRSGGTATGKVSSTNLVNGKQAMFFDGNDILTLTTAFTMPSTFDWFLLSENTNKTANAGFGFMLCNRTVTSGGGCGAIPTHSGTTYIIGTANYQSLADDHKDYALYNFSDTSGTSKVIRRNNTVLTSSNTSAAASGTISGFGRYRGTGAAYSTALTQGAVLYNNGDAASYRSDINNYLMSLTGIS